MNKQSTLFDDYVNLCTDGRVTRVALLNGFFPDHLRDLIWEECSHDKDLRYELCLLAETQYNIFCVKLEDSLMPIRPELLYNTDSVTTINKNISNVFDKVFDRIGIWSKIPGNKFNFDLYTYELKAISDYQIELIITEKPTNNYINDLTADDCMDTVKFFKGGSDENN